MSRIPTASEEQGTGQPAKGATPPVRKRRRLTAVEAVAKEIRDSILLGVVREGDLLPRLETLMEQHGTSKLTMREALRILEIEGFVSVQRGNMGGAVAHFPTEGNAAYALSLVFESQGLTVAELAESIERLEPACLESCAVSTGAAAVLPHLAAAQSKLADCISRGDLTAALSATQEWHRALVENCGNRAIAVTLGALEEIWWTHSARVGAEESAHGVDISESKLRRVYMEHAEIQQMIADERWSAAADALRAHVRRTMPGAAVVVYAGDSKTSEPRVSADEMRGRLDTQYRRSRSVRRGPSALT